MEKITRRKFVESAARAGLTGLAGLILIGCKDEGVVRTEEFTIYVSQEFKDRRSTWIRYCGMPNEKTFSLSGANNFAATNLYYPKDTKQINFKGGNYEVVSVDPNKITLRKFK